MSDQAQGRPTLIFPQSSSSAASTNVSHSTTLVQDLVGSVTKTIGTGENAKNSIILLTIKWSFYIATGITGAVFILLSIAYFRADLETVKELLKHMFNIWSILTPIITLALGYAFGRNQTS